MSSEHDHIFTRDDGETEITVYYVIESYGEAANWDDPGSGPELYIDKAFPYVADCQACGNGGTVKIAIDDAVPCPDCSVAIELTDAERDRIETAIHENPEWWEPYDGPDDY